jgi:hypothetical protein
MQENVSSMNPSRDNKPEGAALARLATLPTVLQWFSATRNAMSGFPIPTWYRMMILSESLLITSRVPPPKLAHPTMGATVIATIAL